MEEKAKEAVVDLLPAWLARQAEVDAGTREWGVPAREQIAALSGVDLFRAMVAGRLPAPPICKTLDFIMVEADFGRIVFQGRPGLAHYNPMGTVHGGWFATLLDSAVGCAVV